MGNNLQLPYTLLATSHLMSLVSEDLLQEALQSQNITLRPITEYIKTGQQAL